MLKYLSITLTFFSINYFSGCMMIGMHGREGGMHSEHQMIEHKSEYKTKEIYKYGFLIISELPVILYDDIALFSITILDEKTNHAIEFGEITIEISRVDEFTTDHHQQHKNDSNVLMQDKFNQIKPGYFEFTKSFREEGKYEYRIKIFPEENASSNRIIEIQNSFEVVHKHQSDHESWFSPWYFLGGIGMILIMVLMMSSF
jgi:hypothetical protein